MLMLAGDFAASTAYIYTKHSVYAVNNAVKIDSGSKTGFSLSEGEKANKTIIKNIHLKRKIQVQ